MEPINHRPIKEVLLHGAQITNMRLLSTSSLNINNLFGLQYLHQVPNTHLTC